MGERPLKAAERVAQEIIQEIVDRGLAPGHRLEPEAIMVQRYGVARGTLREALRLLEVQGLLSIRPGPGGGAVVGEVDTRNFARTTSLFLQMSGARIRAIVEARVVLEPVFARQAAVNKDRLVIEGLQRVVDESMTVDLRDDRAYLRMSAAFHSAVARGSGNQLLDLFGSTLTELFSRRVNSTLIPPGRRDKLRAHHAEIVAAIAAGDGDLAYRLMEEDMHQWYAGIRTRLAGVLDEPIDWS